MIVRSSALFATGFVLVCPINDMPLVIRKVEFHTAVPAGSITVSPSAAEFMAAVTSAREGLAAFLIAACVALEVAKNNPATTELITA
jgi:hypothetical protein